MSQLDDLLSRSRSPGRFVERRAFTLSREKAIEKQREFALRHPRQYVLELIQAAVFAGATYLAVDTRPHAVLVAWVGGRSLGRADLENLFDYLFADRGDARWRHLVQLALGVNAVLQRRPRSLRLESGDGRTAVRLDLDADGRGAVGVPQEPIDGTYLYVEYGAGWFTRFLPGGPTAEQALVEERCLYTPVPILLNGAAPFGYRGGRHIEVFGAELQESFDDGRRRGVVARHRDPRAPTGFRVVVGGVWITTLPLAELADRALVGVVCDDGLRKTADQSDIVQDERYLSLLHALQPIVTRVIRREEPSWRPPRLPPVPAAAPPPTPGAPPAPAAEPLPDPIPCLAPRDPVTPEEVERGPAPGVPWFYVHPSARGAIEGRATEPDRFPWRILVLTEGEALTLRQALGERPLHRLTSLADLDFVRRVVDRRARFRDLTLDGPGFRVVCRLHLEGPPPDWGHGQPGVPFCVVDARGVVEHGVIDGRRVIRCGGRPQGAAPPSVRPPDPRERETGIAAPLPGVSLRIEGPGVDRLRDEHLARVLSEAHALAAPPDGEVHRPLLAHLLGSLAAPQLVREGERARLGASLPVGWPAALTAAPLVDTDRGPLSWDDLAALAGGAEVREVASLDDLLALDAVERRLGHGHLAHPTLDAFPVFAAGRRGERWAWLQDEDWRDPGLAQVVWVAGTFRPREQDAEWRTHLRPAPVLVGSARRDVTPSPWGPGWQCLLAGIRGLEAKQSWALRARGPITAARAETLGRLALIAATRLFGGPRTPLLVPTDGGGRRSLDALRRPGGARFVARHGIRLAEPGTFAVTLDELAAIEADGHRVALRYDDDPQVWGGLARAEGWLVRQEVDQGGLRGWLGLRLPPDDTGGILLRTTGQLIALSELEQAVPCHGLLWPADGSTRLAPEQRRTAQLAGLRLYQSLAGLLDPATDPERRAAAERYAIPFVWRAWRRGGLRGTAADLARRVTVRGPDGRPWGDLAAWLDAPPAARPAVDPALLPEDPAAEPPELPAPRDDLHARLFDALGRPDLALSLSTAGPDHAPIAVDGEGSDRGRVVVWLDERHPTIRAALDRPGPERELVLLEVARAICAWAPEVDLPLDLLRAQQVLLAQRLES